jgi:hypothetical protein
VWYGLTAAETDALLAAGRRAGFTVQAALSAAAQLALVHAVGATLPQTLLNTAPVNLRPYLPCEPDSCGAGAAALWWAQPLQAGATLASVAAAARAGMRAELARGAGMGYRYRMVHRQGQQPPHASMASSIGVLPLQTRYGPVQLHDVHLLVGMYQAASGRALLLSHAITFAGRLRCVVGYAAPAVPEQLARRYAAAQESILRLLISEPELSLASLTIRLDEGRR